MALMNGLTTLVNAYIPLPGRTQAVYASTGLSYYRHPDWLGSSRFASTPSRTKSADGAYAPFGEPYGTGGGPPILAFSGQNQDTATGLYDFLFREYAPTQGRWISPDPAGRAAADPSDPQSWNRYAYVSGSPLSRVDWLGLIGPGPCLDRSQCIGNLHLDVEIVCFFGGGCGGAPTEWVDDSGGADGPPILKRRPTPTCPPTQGISKWVPHGLTWGGTGNASVGLTNVGAMADGSGGAGLFISQAGQVSSGMFASGGASAFAGSHNASAPQQSKISPFAVGAYGGVGTFVSVTNAQSMNQLSGPFAQWNANIGFGAGYSLTLQYDNKSGIWNFSISRGPGFGLSGTAMTTTTAVKTDPSTCH